jgi:hypothetical protein
MINEIIDAIGIKNEKIERRVRVMLKSQVESNFKSIRSRKIDLYFNREAWIELARNYKKTAEAIEANV